MGKDQKITVWNLVQKPGSFQIKPLSLTVRKVCAQTDSSSFSSGSIIIWKWHKHVTSQWHWALPLMHCVTRKSHRCIPVAFMSLLANIRHIEMVLMWSERPETRTQMGVSSGVLGRYKKRQSSQPKAHSYSLDQTLAWCSVKTILHL